MKKLLAVLISSMLVLPLAGCGQTYQEVVNPVCDNDTQEEYLGNYFTEITNWFVDSKRCRIVYANDTKVKYLVIESGYQFGITPLYNTDGALQVYEENVP